MLIITTMEEVFHKNILEIKIYESKLKIIEEDNDCFSMIIWCQINEIEYHLNFVNTFFIEKIGIGTISNIDYLNFEEIIDTKNYLQYKNYKNTNYFSEENKNINYFKNFIFKENLIYENISNGFKKHFLNKEERNNFHLTRNNVEKEKEKEMLLNENLMFNPKNKIKIYYPKFTKLLGKDFELYIRNEIHRKNKVELTYINKVENDLILDLEPLVKIVENKEYIIYQLKQIYVKDLVQLVDNTKYFTFCEISFKNHL